jgi:MFS family permease
MVAALALAILGSGCVAAGPAQDVLADLARSERTARIASGIGSVAVGAAIGIAGSLLLTDPTLQTYGWIAGGLVAAPGLLVLAVPSQAELAARHAETETEAVLALERLAAGGRTERMISGVANLAAGVAALVFPYRFITPYDYLYSAVYSFGSAALDFLLLSKEERAYNTYRELALVSE